MNNSEWFPQARFGMMIHWGLYSLLAGEYEGERMGGADDGKRGELGEWAQSYFRIPCAKYEKLAGAFNPVAFDAEEWVKLAKAAGMQYIVITSKHHEGFAMFRSAADPYNIVDATPFHRDPLAELAAACKKHGLKLGLYYSQELDWHEPDGGGYTRGRKNERSAWTNDWDFPDNEHKDYSRCLEKKIKPQVQEILTQYGDLCLIWFDTPGVISQAQSRELYDLVKRLQPDCLINSRIGNGLGDYTSMGDNQVPGGRKDRGMLYETAATLNDTWGYKAYDQHWKSADEVISLLTRLASRNVNYLLNIGPDHLGRIPAPAQDILRRVGAWIQVNGEAVYGSQPSPYGMDLPSGPVTEKGDSLYFVLNHPEKTLIVPGVLCPVAAASVLGVGNVPFLQEGEQVTVSLPDLSGQSYPVVKLTAPGGVKVREGILQMPDGSILLTPALAEISGGIAIGKACDTEQWTDERGALTWIFSAEAGEYDVKMTVNGLRPIGPVQAEVALDVNGSVLAARASRDGVADPLLERYRPAMVSRLGQVHLRAGENRLSLRLTAPVTRDMFRFASLRLTRL